MVALTHRGALMFVPPNLSVVIHAVIGPSQVVESVEIPHDEATPPHMGTRPPRLIETVIPTISIDAPSVVASESVGEFVQSRWLAAS